MRVVFRPADFFVELFLLLVRAADFRDDVFRDVFRDVRLRGTFSPFSLASLIPIASACLRLVTLRPPRVFSVPCLRRRIALPTVELAFLLYFLPDAFRLDLRAAIQTLPERLICKHEPGLQEARPYSSRESNVSQNSVEPSTLRASSRATKNAFAEYVSSRRMPVASLSASAADVAAGTARPYAPP